MNTKNVHADHSHEKEKVLNKTGEIIISGEVVAKLTTYPVPAGITIYKADSGIFSNGMTIDNATEVSI